MSNTIRIYIYMTTIRAKAKRILMPFFESIELICNDFKPNKKV